MGRDSIIRGQSQQRLELTCVGFCGQQRSLLQQRAPAEASPAHLCEQHLQFDHNPRGKLLASR
jgi:hypothetical protein